MRSHILSGSALVLLLAVSVAGDTGPAISASRDSATFLVAAPPVGLRGLCLAAVEKTETKPFAVGPAQAADPMWLLRPDPGSPPPYDGLGTPGYPVTTTVPEAQGYSDQGLRLA